MKCVLEVQKQQFQLMELEDTFISCFTRKLQDSKPESFQASKEIIDSICDNILNHYEYIDYINSKRQTRQQDQGLWINLFFKKQQSNQKINQTLIEMISKDGFISRIDLKNELLPVTKRVEHLKVHKQFVGNLCGYHASYNLIQAIHSIKYQIPIQFENIASFWSYVHRTQQFLKQWAIQTRKDTSSWPWTDDDIQQGDFERTYLKVLLQYKPLFLKTFQTDSFNGIKFIVHYNTLFFQYGNIINSYEERSYLQKQITEFNKFQPDEKNQMIFACMMGVTNHWMSMVAQKHSRGVNFFLMDSRNRDYLLWGDQQMNQFLIEENNRRAQIDLKPFTEFQKEVHLTCMHDIQMCMALFCSWLSGQSTVEQFVVNARLQVFLKPLMKLMNLTSEGFMSFQLTKDNLANTYNLINTWADGFRHTIDEYLYIPIVSMNPENVLLVRKTVSILEQVFSYQKVNKLWAGNTKRNRIELVLQQMKTIQNRL